MVRFYTTPPISQGLASFAPDVLLPLVRFFSTPPISPDALLARIRADATIREPVRVRALEFARDWPEAAK